MRIDECLRQARAAGLDRSDAEILLAAALGMRRTQVLAWPEQEVAGFALPRFLDWQQRRLDGVPVAYLLGHKEFHGLRFNVGPEVLVPRPETELLVEFALAHAPAAASAWVADLGTGSGALACALAAARPDWQLSAIERSAAALQTARANGEQLGLVNIEWLQGSWYEPLGQRRFHLLLSNPPYLAADDPHLSTLRHEPTCALVAGPEGLECLRHLIAGAPLHLEGGGWLALEHGWDQAAEVRALLLREGFVDIRSVTDLAGIERITAGHWSGPVR